MDEKKNKIICIIGVAILIGLLSTNIFSSIRLNKLGRLCDQYRERIAAAEATNQQLAGTIGECQSVCEGLAESVDRNISSAREAIECIEQLRVEIAKLEDCCRGINWDEYYSYWDNYYSLSQ